MQDTSSRHIYIAQLWSTQKYVCFGLPIRLQNAVNDLMHASRVRMAEVIISADSQRIGLIYVRVADGT